MYLDPASKGGLQALVIVVDSSDVSVEVDVTATEGTTGVYACAVADGTHAVAASACPTAVRAGTPFIIAHGSGERGIEVVSTPAEAAVTLDEVTVTYHPTDRTVTLALPDQAPPAGASVCKDNVCNPFVEFTPQQAGRVSATATWTGVASALLDLESGAITAHSYSATGIPYLVIASEEGDSTTGPGSLSISGPIGATEAAVAISNTGKSPLLAPTLHIVWP